MRLLSKELVSLEYREQLQRDLARAKVCRFLIAYVSLEGLRSIGRHFFSKVLRDNRSFGIASLSCSCGYEPLLNLQKEFDDVRLKYFMDPIVNKEKDEPSDLVLFHTKLVYLLLEGEAKSIVYIGSHNWSRRALGPGTPRNAEASLRFEVEHSPDDLQGMGTSIASHVNRHLLNAWDMASCIPATEANRPVFEQWYEKGCRRAAFPPLQEVTVILAVRTSASGSAGPLHWQDLSGHGIYMQVLEEGDGQLVWNSNDFLLVLVWDSEDALRAAQQPTILRSRITTSNAGLDSQLRGTNQAAAPIEGFRAVIYDNAQWNAHQKSSQAVRAPVRIWSKRDVNVYDFEFPTQRSTSSQVDGKVRPKYQFHLEVEQVVFPAEGDYPETPDFVWQRESFAVAKSRNSAKVEETPGYFVEHGKCEQIMECLKKVLLVDTEKVKVLPYSDRERHKVGKRVSEHPVHDTFIGPKQRDKALRDKYYERAEKGALVAEIDAMIMEDHAAEREGITGASVLRVQRVFTIPLDELTKIWGETAQHIREQRRK